MMGTGEAVPVVGGRSATDVTESAIRFSNVTKHYHKEKVASLVDVSFSIPQNSVFGLLGPNGAGKTTAILLMMGFIRPTRGLVEIQGHRAGGSGELRKKVGYIPDGFGVYDQLTAREHIAYFARLNDVSIGKEDIEAVLRRVGLGDAINKRAGTFSLGMKQRLVIGILEVKNPSIIIMDEPTRGLDLDGVDYFKRKVAEWRSAGKTLILSTHQIEQLGETLTHMAVLNRGRLLWTGSVNEHISAKEETDPRMKSFKVYTEIVAHRGGG
jgi:ABC-2 type transport system ATP-binding protein